MTDRAPDQHGICPECRVPLDEIPFDECATHRRHFASEPPLTEEELQEYIDGLTPEEHHD